MKRHAGFTLIEILIVVAIICVMLAVAVASVASGRDAARARAAARGVSQMSHYASALALLRQRTAVISFSGNTISVQLSGEGVDTSEVGSPALPIYQEVNGVEVTPQVVEVESDEAETDAGGGKAGQTKGYLYTEDPLDLDDLAKEDATRSFEGVVFRVELVDEEGRALDAQTASQLRSEANALVAKRKPAGAAWSNTSGEIDLGAVDNENAEGEGQKGRSENDGRIIYETNGNCAPYRVIIFAAAEGDVEGEELMTVHVARSGKVTIGDEEESNGK